MSGVTPLDAVTRGLAAGLLGTAVFTGYQALRGQGHVESAEEAEGSDWSEAPPPAQVGQRVAEGVFQHEVPREQGGRLQMAVHFAYGTFWGGVYGLLHESRRGSAAVDGVGLAAAVVATDYTLLPAMGLRGVPWRSSPAELAKDFADHVVYGLSVAGAYGLVARVRPAR
jgi:hypothetical protein